MTAGGVLPSLPRHEDVADVVVVGAGLAGLRAATAVREHGFAGRVTLVGNEDHGPYQRPPLSKEHLAAAAAGPPLPLRGPKFYARKEIDLVLGDAVREIDRSGARAVLGSGRVLRWDRLVLAQGARARPLPVPGADLVLTLRDPVDADRLHTALHAGPRLAVVVVGAGFLGLEVAAAARGLGHDVTVVEAADRVLARVASDPTAGHVAALHRSNGVFLQLGRTVRAVHPHAGRAAGGGTAAVELDDGRRIPADVVVGAVGAVPETALAAAAGLTVHAGPGGGIAVDDRLRTSDPRILAAGDCASTTDPVTGSPVRIESVQNAEDQGRYAGAALLGVETGPYTAVPWGWTRQFGTSLQTAGTGAGTDSTVLLGDPAGPFSVLCFTGERLRAVESVDAPGDHVAARALLADGGPTPAEAACPGYVLRSTPVQRAG